jgi:hypothetical protein
MIGRIVTTIGATLLLVATSGAAIDAQKGKPAGPKPGTASFDCFDTSATRGICADGPLAAELGGSTGELRIATATGMELNFNGQAAEDRVDCSREPVSTCLWDWSQDPRSDFLAFSIGTNTFNESGTSEIAGGLLAIPENVTHRVRFNMTISVPETVSFWRFNYNPQIPTTGGADLAEVIRTGPCDWTFTALNGERAALSTLVKSKGKQTTHHEGTFAMPFVLTLNVPNCQG